MATFDVLDINGAKVDTVELSDAVLVSHQTKK